MDRVELAIEWAEWWVALHLGYPEMEQPRNRNHNIDSSLDLIVHPEDTIGSIEWNDTRSYLYLFEAELLKDESE